MNYIQLNSEHKDYVEIPYYEKPSERRSDLMMRMLLWKLSQNFRDIREGLDRLATNYNAGRNI